MESVVFGNEVRDWLVAAAVVPAVIREVLEGEDVARFDRSHFKAFGDSALLSETVFYVTDPAYATLMDVQQRVNLALLRRFEAEGVELPCPTRTVFVRRAGTDPEDGGADLTPPATAGNMQGS